MRRATEKLIVGIATLLGSVAGCSYECHCPSDGCFNCSSNSRAEASITVQGDAASVLSASADSPCTATFQGLTVLVSRVGPGSCTARVVFTGGRTEVSQVRFSAVSGPCGCSFVGNISPLEPTDAAPSG
jgi:hypothetical protein